MADTVHLSLDEAHALALGALAASGFSDDQARAVADTVIAAERDGCTSPRAVPHPLLREGAAESRRQPPRGAGAHRSRARRGRVPLALIEERWTAPQNPSEKYFEAPPAAMWTAALVGQDDPAAIEALIGRLERKNDPLWLRGDALGALVTLTGQRFGYDAAAWRRWWQQGKPALRE